MVTGGSGASWPSGACARRASNRSRFGFVEMNLRGLLDDDDAILVRNARGQRVQQRRLAGAGPAGDEHVLLRRNRAA